MPRSAAAIRSLIPEDHVNGTPYPEEFQRAALELAAVVGIRAAGRQLHISKTSITRWVEDHAEYWSELRSGNVEAQKVGFAQRLEDLAENYTATEQDAIERAQELLADGDLDAKELAALIKALGSSRGVATAGARAIRGEDRTAQEVNVNFPQLERAMEALLNGAAPPPLPTTNLADGHALPAADA